MALRKMNQTALQRKEIRKNDTLLLKYKCTMATPMLTSVTQVLWIANEELLRKLIIVITKMKLSFFCNHLSLIYFSLNQ